MNSLPSIQICADLILLWKTASTVGLVAVIMESGLGKASSKSWAIVDMVDTKRRRMILMTRTLKDAPELIEIG